MKAYITNYKEKKYWEEFNQFEDGIDFMKMVHIYPELTYQEMDGFGGAFTEAAGYNMTLLSPERQAEVIQAYFGEDGLQYNMGRTHINSCDFGLGNYAYMEDMEDKEFKTFSMEQDFRYIIPMLKEALKISPELKLLATPWSPPAFMKTNGEMNNGGKLKEEFGDMWAEYIVRFIQEYKKNDLPIEMLSIQNEPEAVQTWDSCIYSAEEEKEFLKKHLGPALKKAGLADIKVFIWDHNKEIAYDRAKGVMDDKEAAEYVTGVAFHWYTGDHFESLRLLQEHYPDLKLYFTEGCVEYSRFEDSDEVTKAEMYAHDMIGNLNEGTSGVIDWNLLLDEKGGPNHVGNFCAAPIMCDTRTNSVEKKLSYYYIGHFSRYIKRGARRFALTRYTSDLEVTGFVNPDGEKIMVVLNRSQKKVDFCVREGETGTRLSIESHTIMTLIV